MRRLSFVRCAALLCAAALTTSACNAPADSADLDTVRIGLLVPPPAGGDDGPTPAEEGARLAAEVVNESIGINALPLVQDEGLPGLGGAKLEIVTDLDGRRDMSAGHVERLVQDAHVSALVGLGTDEQVAETSRRAEHLGVPYLSAGATQGHLTDRGFAWYFRVGVTDAQIGEAFAAVLARRPDATPDGDVALLYPEDTAGAALAADLSVALQARGFETRPAPVDPADRDDTEAVSAALGEAVRDAGGVDGVVLAGSDTAAARAAVDGADAAFAAAGSDPAAVLAVGGGFDEATIRTATEKLPTFLVAGEWSTETADRNIVADAVTTLYRQRFGRDMTPEAATSFTATYVLARALDESGSLNRERVRTALAGLDVPGRELLMPWDGVRFDERHQNTAARATVRQIVDGQSWVVEPAELARTSVAWTGAGEDQ